MMQNLDWLLEVVLVGLLAVTMVHAIRLEKAIRALRQDRSAFGEAVAGFDSSARQAEAGISRLQGAAAEAALQVSRRVEQAAGLKDDLAFLTERGEALADKLDALVRSARGLAATPPPSPIPAASQPAHEAMPKVRSQAERDLLLALRGAQ